MKDSDGEGEGFEFVGESVEVRELSTGDRVDRADIAAKAIGAMTEAVEMTGGKMDSSNVRLIRPGTITGYAPRDPAFEFTIDYAIPLAEMIEAGGFGTVDPVVLKAAVGVGSGTENVVARLINLDRLIDGDTAIKLLDVTGHRPATVAELVAFATQYLSTLYNATVPALGTRLTGRDDGSARVAVLEVREWTTRLVSVRLRSEWDRACRFLAVAT